MSARDREDRPGAGDYGSPAADEGRHTGSDLGDGDEPARGDGDAEYRDEPGHDDQAHAAPEEGHDDNSAPVDGSERVTREAPSSAPGSRRIFVGNLPWSTTGEDCVEYFNKYGEVEKAQIIYKKDDPGAGRSRGIAFVTFTTEEATHAAANDPEDQVIDDRRLNIEVATMQGHNSATKYRPPRNHRPYKEGYSRDERGSDRSHDRPSREERRRGDRGAVPPRDPYDSGYRGGAGRDDAPPPRREVYEPRGGAGGRAGRGGEYVDDPPRGGGGRSDVYATSGDRGGYASERAYPGERGAHPGGSYPGERGHPSERGFPVDRERGERAPGYPPRDVYDADPRDRVSRGGYAAPPSREGRDVAPMRAGGYDERQPSGRGNVAYDVRDPPYDRRGAYPDEGQAPYRDEGPPSRYSGRDDPYRHGGPVYSDNVYPPRGGGRYESDVGGYAGRRGEERGGGRAAGPPAADRGRGVPPVERDRYERDYAAGGDRYVPSDRGLGGAAYDEYTAPPRGGGGGGRGPDRAPAGGYDEYPRGGSGKGDRGSNGSYNARAQGAYDRNGGGGGGANDRRESYGSSARRSNGSGR